MIGYAHFCLGARGEDLKAARRAPYRLLKTSRTPTATQRPATCRRPPQGVVRNDHEISDQAWLAVRRTYPSHRSP